MESTLTMRKTKSNSASVGPATSLGQVTLEEKAWNYEIQDSGDNYGPVYMIVSGGKSIGECLRVTDAKAIVAAHNATIFPTAESKD